VNNTLARNNVNIAGGSLYENEARYLVRTLNEFQKVNDLPELIVKEDDQRKILLRDVARVERGTKEREVVTRINGKEGVELAIFKEGDANTVQVAKAAKEKLKSIEKTSLGSSSKTNIGMVIMFDQSKFIQDSINEVRDNAIIGGLLAIFILFFFLKEFRSTVIIGLSIPISIITTFFVMYQLGIKLNIMSLGGLALGVGMLVDDAIVVLESIVRHYKAGKPLATAAFDGAKEVGLAVTASTLTTVVVFLPISFIEGIAGQMFKDLAITVTVSLLVSMISAFALIPMLFSRGLKKASSEIPQYRNKVSRAVFYKGPTVALLGIRKGIRFLGRIFSKLIAPFVKLTDALLNVFYRSYPGILKAALRFRWTVLAATAGLVGLSLLLISSLGVELIPPVSQGEFSFQIELPQGTPLTQTQKVLTDVEQKVRAIPDVKTCMILLGRNANVSWTAAESYENSAVLNIKVSGKNLQLAEEATAEKIRGILDRYPDLVYKMQRPSLFSFRTPIEVEVYGDDLESASKSARELEARLKGISGLTDIKSSWEEGSPEAHILFDREQLARFNLNLQDVANILKSKVRGDIATEFREGDEEIDIRVWNEDIDRNSIEDLQNMSIARVDNVSVPLKAVAQVVSGRGPNEIRRINQKRAIVISANLAGASLGQVSKDINRVIDQTQMPAKVNAILGGQNEELQRSFRSLYLVAGLSIFLVYFVMAAQFESLKQPFVLMFTVPLSIIGIAWILWVTQQEISVIVFMGFIILAGIVVKNGIILVDYINHGRKSGLNMVDAIVEAAKVRIRPIIMTTLCTLLGLIPMAFSTGEGSEIRAPLAITVIGGLTVSTILTMIIIPILYSLTEREKVAADAVPAMQTKEAEA
jgi:HAE1 family hydrophobic/amphiphilic exporter-1